MVIEPLYDGFKEARQCVDDGNVPAVSDFPDVFDAGRKFRVRRKWKDKGFDGRVGGEKSAEVREVFRGGDDGYGYGWVSETKLVGEIEKSQRMALCWEREDQDVCHRLVLVCARHWFGLSLFLFGWGMNWMILYSGKLIYIYICYVLKLNY